MGVNNLICSGSDLLTFCKSHLYLIQDYRNTFWYLSCVWHFFSAFEIKPIFSQPERNRRHYAQKAYKNMWTLSTNLNSLNSCAVLHTVYLNAKNMHLNFPNGKVQYASCVQHVQCWDFITISKCHFHSTAQTLTRAMDIVSDVSWPVVFKSQQFSQLLFLVVCPIFIDTGSREVTGN